MMSQHTTLQHTKNAMAIPEFEWAKLYLYIFMESKFEKNSEPILANMLRKDRYITDITVNKAPRPISARHSVLLEGQRCNGY